MARANSVFRPGYCLCFEEIRSAWAWKRDCEICENAKESAYDHSRTENESGVP